MTLKKANINWDSLGFDLVQTRSMYTAYCRAGQNWEKGSLIPYGNIELSPGAVVLNYGQGVFEGTKAFQTLDGRVALFRIDKNAERIAWSTERLCIPKMNHDFFIDAVFKTVKDNLDFVPPYGKGSLYIRPIVWGTSPALGVRPAKDYRFVIYVSPVGPYFKGDIKLLNLKIETNYHRAAPKGIGNAKAIGNYSASLFPLAKAKEQGFDEVIYLDAISGDRIEEIGSANIFVYHNGILKTPNVSGSILDGVTRDSVCKIATEILELEVQETDIFLSDLFSADEVFCTGTAVQITPVGTVTHNNTLHKYNNGDIGPVTKKLKKTLTKIQRGESNDLFGWLFPVNI
ncbi:MAG: branched chain amino acid aminotransferase [Candidatus Marinimicrobia bacterium]|nr:branched chain amino acid aminotransferase [Candidatus Neomarinimicrobiota bacterium]|tara:strand:+ start:389 stop:1420 length:1032 start_codon:yes stop_codon:yes gene_type:complete